MKKNYDLLKLVFMLMVFIYTPGSLLAQSSIAGTWKGITVLQVSENDYVGVPGEVTIALSYIGGKLQGTIRDDGLFFGQQLFNISFQTNKLNASFSYGYASKTVQAKLFLTRDGLWMYGLIDLGVKIGHTKYIRVYIKKQ